jgi:hypothetical protein
MHRAQIAQLMMAGARFFSSPQRPDQLWCPPTLLSNWYCGLFPQGVKRPGREADHSPPSSADIKNGGAIPSLPMSSWHNVYLIKHKDNFTFIYIHTICVMKNSSILDIKLCSLVKVNWCFRGTCYLQLQCWRLSQAGNSMSRQQVLTLLAACFMLVSCFA